VPSDTHLADATHAPPTIGTEPPTGARVMCRPAVTTEERALHFAIRHEVFVEEQSIFTGSDRDSYDERDSVIRLLGYCDGVVAGSVRLFELDPVAGLWQGDRLAVLPAYRLRGVGAPLVRCAVAAAGVHGGRLMEAHIQLGNVSFFERLGWTRAGETELYAGLVHQPMHIALPTVDEGAAVLDRFAAGVNVRGL
jgi:putative N-acetyltransferase (TIGR04045 family)